MLLAHNGGVDEAAVIVLPLLPVAASMLAEQGVRTREHAAETGDADLQETT